jgi:hypothetical protein
LPRRASERLALTDQLLDVQRKRDLLADDEAWLKDVLGDHWRGERTDFENAQAVAHWLGEVRDGGVVQTPEVLSRALDAFDDPAGLAARIADLVRQASDVVALPLGRLSYDLSTGASPHG